MSIAEQSTRHDSQAIWQRELRVTQDAINFLPEWAEIDCILFAKDRDPTIRLKRESFLRMFAGQSIEVEPQNEGDDLLWVPFHLTQLETTYTETGWPRKEKVTLPEWSEA